MTGEVGASDPLDAIGDVLARDPDVAEIVISTLPQQSSRWLRRDLPSRVRSKFDANVVHIEAES